MRLTSSAIAIVFASVLGGTLMFFGLDHLFSMVIGVAGGVIAGLLWFIANTPKSDRGL